MKVNIAKQANHHHRMPRTNKRNKRKKRIKLLMLQIMCITEEMRREEKIQYCAIHRQHMTVE